MARILVQTQDRHTVLEERDLGIGDINDERAAANLLTRLEEAISQAESRKERRRARVRRFGTIAPTTDYREVHG